jgi:hypothetical protein
MRLLVKDTGKAKQLETAFAAIFSVGIDPGLQRAMPDYWRRYFDPTLAWLQDALSGQTSSYFLRRSSEISHFLGLTLETVWTRKEAIIMNNWIRLHAGVLLKNRFHNLCFRDHFSLWHGAFAFAFC